MGARAGQARQVALTIGVPSAKYRLGTIGESAAGRARALAALTAYPGWPDETALAMLRSALSLSLGWHRYVFFGVLTAAVPFLARLDGGLLERTAREVLDIDSWRTPHAGVL